MPDAVLLTLGEIPEGALQAVMAKLPVSQWPPRQVSMTEADFGNIFGELLFEDTIVTPKSGPIDRSKVGSKAIQQLTQIPMDKATVVIVCEGIFITWCASNPDNLVAEFPNANAIFAALPNSNNHRFTRVK